jgi:hypothetical protein
VALLVVRSSQLRCVKIEISPVYSSNLARKGFPLDVQAVEEAVCSGSMIPDTNVGGNIATINEVSDDQKATFFFS